MKKFLFISVLFTSFLFSSCGDDLEDLLDVSFEVPIVEEIDVDVASGTNPLNQTVVFSLSENTETNKYLDKLKTLEIKKMTYKVIDFEEGGDATGKITASLKANGTTLHSITDVTVKTAFDNATVYEVTNKAALVTAATSLLQNKTISLETSGTTVSTSAMSFIIEVTLELGVVANPL
jgi:hypothetical protein